MKKIIFINIGTIALIVIGFLLFNFYPRTGFVVDKNCELDIDPYGSPKAGILGQSWKNDDTLEIKAYINTYCSGAKIEGNHVIENDNIVLEYEIIQGTMGISECYCAHKVGYEISSLEKKDYSVFINKKK